MAGISISDAAFSGFRIVREHPLAVPIWAAVMLAFSLSTTLLMTSMAGPALMQYQQPGTDPKQSLAVLQQLLPAYGVILPLSLVFYAVIYAAMSRAVLRPGDSRFGYLRLGVDELRQLGLGVLYVLVLMGVYILLLLALMVVTVLATMIFAAGGKPSPEVMGLVMVIGFIAVLGVLIWFMTRMSLASPLTFATGRIDLFGSWALTRDHFWPIFWTYTVAFLLVLLVAILGLAITMAFIAVAGGVPAAVGSIFRPDLSSVSAVLKPGRLIYLVGSAIFSALILPVSIAPPATIYRALRASSLDEHGAPIDSVFR